MVGISIAAKEEWKFTLDYYHKEGLCQESPYGEYFIEEIDGRKAVFYNTGVRKVNGTGTNQYMICKFGLEKIIVVGTCAGIDDRFSCLDIFVPNLAVQYDCTVKEIEPLVKQSFNVEINTAKYGRDFLTGTIGTADKVVVMWKDYLELRDNGITIADTEAAAVAYICKKNHVECAIIKGISDFPIDERDSDKITSHDAQLNVYLNNTPKVMKKIFDDYLYRFI